MSDLIIFLLLVGIPFAILTIRNAPWWTYVAVLGLVGGGFSQAVARRG